MNDIAVHIRWMIRRDMPEVLEIESKSFEHPWNEFAFIRVLRQRNCIGMISEYEERVIAFMVYELKKDEIGLLNFAVHPDYRRRGVGRQMVQKIKYKLGSRRQKVTLETSEYSLGAQLFWRAVGFKATSILKDFYDHEFQEDAIAFEYRIKSESLVEARG